MNKLNRFFTALGITSMVIAIVGFIIVIFQEENV